MATHRYDVFLSHNSADKPSIEILARRMVEAGLRPWFDTWNLIPGTDWQAALEEALAECTTCAVFIGPNGTGAWQNAEMRAAIDRRVADSKHEFRVIPVLLPGAERGERSKLPDFLTATTWVEFRSGLDDKTAFHRLVSGIRGHEPGPSPSEAIYAGITPYRGLQVFDVDDWRLFFGREALVEWLLDEVRPNKRTKPENRFLGIIGPSGSGKSSLARAGLAAALKQGKIGSSETWPIAIFKPGGDPVESLAVAVTAITNNAQNVSAVRSLISDLSADPRTLHLATRLALRDAPQRRLIVLVDQFEEVFTLCQDEAKRKATIDTLLHAATVVDGQTIVVLTLRADFYGKCAAYPNLAAALSDHQMLVGPMSRDELRRATERPARLAGCEFESGLVERLLDDVVDQPGSLPLLQHALLELWNQRAGRKLTHAAYREIGGVEGALERRAEAVYAIFNATEQAICRRIFLRLTQLGDGTEDTRRRASIQELLPATDDIAAFDTVLQKLTGPEARLVTGQGELNNSDETGDSGRQDNQVVEVAHEALIHSWSRLRSWLDEDRAALRIHRQITELAAEWTANHCDVSYLYRGARLSEAQEWAAKHDGDLNAGEKTFIEASIAARNTEQQAAQRRLRRTIGGLVSALVTISLFAAIAVYFWQSANAAARVDRGRLLVKQGQDEHPAHPLLGLRLALEGLMLVPQEKQSVAELTAQGRLMLLSDDSDEFIVSPDGRAFVVNNRDQPDELRRTADGQVITTFTGDLDNTSWRITFSSDGHAFAVNYQDQPDELRRTADGQVITTFISALNLWDSSFSPDNQVFVASYHDKPRELRRTADGQVLMTFIDNPDLSNITFSPDSQVFVADYLDKPSELRRTTNGQLIMTFIDGLTVWVTFSPDSHTFFVDYVDKPGELRRTADGQVITTLTGTLNSPGATFSLDGQVFVVNYADKPGELRRTTNGQLITTFTDNPDLSSITFSPDSHTFFVDYVDKPGELRRTADGQVLMTFADIDVFGNPFSPDSHAFVVTYSDQPNEVWDFTGTPRRLAVLGLGTYHTIFSPNAQQLVVRHVTGEVYLLDLDWLRTMDGDPAKLPLEELVRISCESVRESGLWTAADDEALKQALGGREPQACK